MSDVLTTINTRQTKQIEAAKSTQVKNNAGGFVFQVTPEVRLRRFLILGTIGGTYYQGEAELTKDNASVVLDWAQTNTKSLVDIVVEISVAGRAPKQNPCIFALAAAAGLGATAEDRRYALDALSKVARTGTHLFLFAQYVEQFRGWGRGLRNAVADWYESKNADKLAYQMVKYRQRNGWSHRDLLRLSHPTGKDTQHKALYTWATSGLIPNVGLEDSLPSLITSFTKAQTASTVSEWLSLIEADNLSWEMLPDVALKEAAVWQALINKGLPQTALMRQLPRLTNLGVLKGDSLKTVVAQLSDQDRLTKARVHPVNVLLAMKTYAGGKSLRGNSSWAPVVKIIDALDDAFYRSFGNVEPANKRTLNALDVSGSMSWEAISGMPITPREASGALSLVTTATEPDVETVAFTSGGLYGRGGLNGRLSGISAIPISAKQRLDDVVKSISNLPWGGTDCALPMLWAMENSKEIDTFIIITDSDTWAGQVHPYQALAKYRQTSGIDAKLIVVGMTATDFTIADPSDSGMLDLVGFDSAVPNLIADFSAGRI